MAVILLRHTRPVLGSEYCYGNLDIDLADSFEADAELAIAQLPAFSRVVSSPLSRARLLAERIAAGCNLIFCIDERVREMDFAAWEGRRWSEIPRAELNAWAMDFMDARPHGGESVREFSTRCREAVAAYEREEGDTLIVCHAGVIRAAFARGDDVDAFGTAVSYGESRRWLEPAAPSS